MCFLPIMKSKLFNMKLQEEEVFGVINIIGLHHRTMKNNVDIIPNWIK